MENFEERPWREEGHCLANSLEALAGLLLAKASAGSLESGGNSVQPFAEECSEGVLEKLAEAVH